MLQITRIDILIGFLSFDSIKGRNRESMQNNGLDREMLQIILGKKSHTKFKKLFPFLFNFIKFYILFFPTLWLEEIWSM